MTDDRHHSFSQRYASGDLPWDSGITPPEIREILAELPPGQALDIGCGTGTSLRAALRCGWRADGIDFVARALELAAAKLSAFPPESIRLFCADATRLVALPGLRAPYDLIIDIGCGHAIDARTARERYASGISALLKPGGVFMLYASHPRPNSTVGWKPAAVTRLFGERLELIWEQRGDDAALGLPASWYRLRKLSAGSLRQ